MQTDSTTGVDRADAFRQEVATMPIRGGTVARERALARLGVVLLVAGPLLGLLGYLQSSGTDNPLVQRDSIVLALIGVSVAVVGLAVFLRYSLGGILRLWLARAVAERDR